MSRWHAKSDTSRGAGGQSRRPNSTICVYKTLWTGLRPLYASVPFVDISIRLRRFVEGEVATLDPPPIDGRLAAAGYAFKEIDDIRALVEVFSNGNFPYLLIATITRYLLEGGEIGVPGEAPPFVGSHETNVQAPLVVMKQG